jgi:hypothetical protein
MAAARIRMMTNDFKDMGFLVSLDGSDGGELTTGSLNPP